MIPINVSLSHYKRSDIQEEILANSKDREVAAKFNDNFGKRPDILRHKNDVLELAKQGATSFHASEELWKNALQLDSSLRKHELDKLRIGWDLILDIDCPIWEYSKVVTSFLIQALKENGINSISCKFSGNKGFHIGVPFEAFPSLTDNKETRLLFPEVARIITSFLINEEIDKEINGKRRLTTYFLESGLADIIEKTGMDKSILIKDFCTKCDIMIEPQKKKFQYTCPQCSKNEVLDEDMELKCQLCKKFMTKKIIVKHMQRSDISNKPYIQLCPKCGNDDLKQKLNLQKILNIDAMLLSSRHLYRMPYSLHEKSGLVSIPISPSDVLIFEKESALPKNVSISKHRFLDKENVVESEAAYLFDKALQWHTKYDKKQEYFNEKESNRERYHEVATPLTEELFPPCIKLILNGLEDGKKRALFILINYLTSIGWNYDMVEKKLREWNAKNREPLREVYLLGQMRYHKQTQKKILPPNCSNEMYMLGIGVCKPDSFCAKIKNPAQYSTKKVWLMNRLDKEGLKKSADAASNNA